MTPFDVYLFVCGAWLGWMLAGIADDLRQIVIAIDKLRRLK